MKKLTFTVFMILTGSFFFLNNLTAQDIRQTRDIAVYSGENISEEQYATLRENRSQQIEFRNKFRETLTGNQLDILTNPGLSREEKLKALEKSLSGSQAEMIKENRKEVKRQNSYKKTTLSRNRRTNIRRTAVNRAQQNRILFQRARLDNNRHRD